MSSRVTARKVQTQSSSTSVTQSPAGATPKKSAPNNHVRKTSVTKSSCPSKPEESEEEKVRVRKPNKEKSTEKKLQSAPDKGKKKQPPEASKTPDTNPSCPLKHQGSSKDVPARRSPKDAHSTEEDTPDSKTGKKCVRRASSTDPNKVLQNALEKLKVRKKQRSESSKCVNDIQDKVIDYLKVQLDWCREISVLKTGSYYENVKICEPDEFDVMLTVRMNRVIIQPFTEDGAFYSVQMKRQPQKQPLDKFVNKDKTLMASDMLNEIREKVKKAMENLPYDVSLERKKPGCPAVTMVVKMDKEICIDFVLGLEVHTAWPDFTKDGFNVDNWLSKKMKKEQRQKPFYLVPKYEGKANEEQDGIMAKDTWRISFSHVEKYILKNHGNSKTCCEGEQKCCRKQCLKLLKYLLQRLKEEYPKEADKLCSYHAKTTLLHACTVRVLDSDWESSELSQCFQLLLQDFEQKLKTCKLTNFFIPSQNLFDSLSKKNGKFLADCIESQRNNGFPLLC